jgi:serine/threonine protein kinase
VQSYSYPCSGALLDQQFRVQEQLLQDDACPVFAGIDEATGRRVALRWLARGDGPDALERLSRETTTYLQLRHPNLLEVLALVRDGERWVLVTELLQGETLADVLARGGMPLDRFITVLMAAMYGVAEAHRCGITHRNIQPRHIFLVPGDDPDCPNVKVLDFELTSPLASAAPSYMSPEQLAGARCLDARTDVYAFGVMLYRAVTGRLPHQADTIAQLLERMGQPASPAQTFCPSLPAGLCSVIGDALARDRDARLESLPAFITALVPYSFARGLVPAEGPAGTFADAGNTLTVRGEAEEDHASEVFTSASPSIPPSYTRAPRRRLPARSAGALLMLALGLTGMLWWSHRDAPGAPPTAASSSDRRPDDEQPPVLAPEAPRPRR